MASITVLGLPDTNSIGDTERYKEGLANLYTWLSAQLVSQSDLAVFDDQITFHPVGCQELAEQVFGLDHYPKKSLEVKVVLFSDKAGRKKRNLEYAAVTIYKTTRKFAQEYLPDTYNWIDVLVEVYGVGKYAHDAGPVAYS